MNKDELVQRTLEEMELFIDSLRKVSDNAPEHIVEAERNYYRKLFFQPPAPIVNDLGSKKQVEALDALVATLILKRSQARAAKNWSESDAIRDMLVSSDIQIEDSPSGTKWSIK